MLSAEQFARTLVFFSIPALLGVFAALGSVWPHSDIVVLPIEVAGIDGTTRSETFDLPSGRSKDIRTLWMRIHGLEYDDLASVQINRSDWVPLNNQSVTVSEPGRSFGGIGGGFATLKLTLALPEGLVTEGPNCIRFRFNRTDGVVSGFRVLAFNFLDREGKTVLPDCGFVHDDPGNWQPPLNDPADISAGATLWRQAELLANGLPHATTIRAHCGDCHAADGRDLKYFNYSNASVIARSRFHGLSEKQSEQIASYIRSLPFPNPGRPWDPPYQPGPGLDAQPIENWAAGAGLSQVLDRDEDSLAFIFRGGITPEAFRPDGNLNARQIPIAMQLPDWNHWLPRVHPLDAWGESFAANPFSTLYEPGLFRPDGILAARFDRWSKAERAFLARHVPRGPEKWSPALMQAVYSSQLWQLVKTWEITQELGLERKGRVWENHIPALTAPASAGIPDGPNGMGGSALTNEYYTNGWYELQLLLNDGGHRHHNDLPFSWPFMAAHVLKLYRQSAKAEPARLLIAIVKAMQSTDPLSRPEDLAEGWRPERNLDPRIMVDVHWSPMFESLPQGQQQAITESLLAAWLDKNNEYPVAEYFHQGAAYSYSSRSYTMPDEARDVFGGRAWEAAPRFQAVGVRPDLIERLANWGVAYRNLSQLFHY